jgi:hypothetical protein
MVTGETHAATQPLRKKSFSVTASVAKPDDFTGLRVGYLEVFLSHAHILSARHLERESAIGRIWPSGARRAM